MLSSLTLARSAEPAAETQSGGNYKRPFVLAGRQIVPRIRNSFRHGESFSLYYQVYGAEIPPDGKAMLQADYQFFVHQEDGLRLLGERIVVGPVTEQAVGWSFPLVGWPAATFRLQVTVTDRHSGRSVTDSVDFTVDD